ncbi:hypothetical protein V3C99_013116 [Haemonchus contortus]
MLQTAHRNLTGGGSGGGGEPAADRAGHINTIVSLHMATTVIMSSLGQIVVTLASLLVLVPTSNACFASGVCGGIGLGFGGGCMGGIPPIPPPACAGGLGCGIGYSCGAYGCYRSRARVHGANTVRDGPILRGADRFSQFRRPTQTSDPNVLFMDCCEQRGLPDACLRHCTYNTFRKDSLIRMYFKQDACPIHATAEIQFCAAQGRDHRACCERNGVTTTLAGAKCLTFCDQRPGNVTMLDMSYVPCYERFENMKACFWHDTVNRLKK